MTVAIIVGYICNSVNAVISLVACCVEEKGNTEEESANVADASTMCANGSAQFSGFSGFANRIAHRLQQFLLDLMCLVEQ